MSVAMQYRYPQPKNEDAFEEFCLVLLREHWSLPTLERYGHRGERQDGVDLLDISGAISLRAVQCKHHDATKTIPPKELEDEVDKARSFPEKIDAFFVLTTAKKSTQAQQKIRSINKEHTTKGLFLVQLLTWDDIERILDNCPAGKEFLGLHIPQTLITQMREGLKNVEIHVAPAQFGIPNVVPLPATDAEAAIALLDRFAAHRPFFSAGHVEYLGECVESAERLSTALGETLGQLRPESELRPLVNTLRAHVHAFLDELRALFSELQRRFDLERRSLAAGTTLTDDQVARVKHYERLGGGDLFTNRRLNLTDLEPEGYRFVAAEVVGKLRGRCGSTLGALCAKFGIAHVPADLAQIIPSAPAHLLDIPLVNGRFGGDLRLASEVLLSADAARAAGEQIVLRLVEPRETELRAWIADKGHADPTEVAQAKLSLVSLETWRRALEALLDFFLVDGRFRSAWVPIREQAAVCLISLINNDGEKHGIEGFTKLALFPEREPAIGTSIMVRTGELEQPALMDGCSSIDEYKEKLIALGGDRLVALPQHIRLELAYPAIIREIFRLKAAGHLKEAWLRLINWAFGLD